MTIPYKKQNTASPNSEDASSFFWKASRKCWDASSFFKAASRRSCLLYNIGTLLFLVTTLLLTACHPAAPTAERMHSATLLTTERTDSFTRIDVKDAWHAGRTLHSYILVPRTAPLPHQLPKGTLLRTPLRRVVIASSVHAALLCDLHAEAAIVGLCDTAYVIHPTLRAALRAGRIPDMGFSYAPNVERLVAARPEAVFVSPMEGGSYGALDAAGIPLIECADYMEQTALGRAEWVKLFGLLFDCEERADSLFCATQTAYDSLRTAAIATTNKPRLLCDMKQGATWYVPGGRSYLGQLYADGGADYIFANRTEGGSVSFSLEAVLAAAGEADVWLVKYGAAANLTYEVMAQENSAYTKFRPWRERNIYGCNTLRVPFYEEVPFHPDRLLRDVVSIFHPELLPTHRLRYFTPLN